MFHEPRLAAIPVAFRFAAGVAGLPAMVDTAWPSRFHLPMNSPAWAWAARWLVVLSLFTWTGTAPGRPAAQQLEKAAVLPLALDDNFQFRKTELFLNDPKLFQPAVEEMINFERQRVNFKAVTAIDRRERYGHYFTFFWRADRQADLTVRLEYRQEKLGPYVQAQEVGYNNVKGSTKTKFTVIGDDYLEDGRVTAWRAVLIENGRIVGITQSYLWN